MRREGYELAVAVRVWSRRPSIAVECEPYEQLTVEHEEEHQGGVMEALGLRKGGGAGYVHKDGRSGVPYRVPHPGSRPDRFPGRVVNLTRGNGLMSHVFDEYAPVEEAPSPSAATAC